MVKVLPADILEKIMIGLDVNDLIRCKCVCKSWQSFVTSSRFVKAHLNHSYNNDHNNNEFGHRRIVLPLFNRRVKFCYHGVDESFVGSSNGLVCISSSQSHILVANPCTREVKKLQNPHIVSWSSLCWGFGYDKLTDDYKVIIGFPEGGNSTRLQVFSLKSNVWKVIGEVNYTCITTRRMGILCNGKLHWFMKNQNNKGVIISFDLSQEKLKKISQPQDWPYEYHSDSTLGIFQECLCIFRPYRSVKWVMKKYNVKESWAALKPYDQDDDVVFFLEKLNDYNSRKSFFIRSCMFESRSWDRYLCAPIFVQSLVSPHVRRMLKRKMDDCK